MKEQKAEIMRHVAEQKISGRTIRSVLVELGVKRSTYYSWLKPRRKRSSSRLDLITPEEKQAIESAKERYPHYRHRQIQGVLQAGGLYLSYSTVYGHLKAIGKVEHYRRRVSPWDEPRYEVWRRNMMWGADWTRLKINHVRWYLLVLIDFFSRYVLAWAIVPSVNSGHVRRIYMEALKNAGVNPRSKDLPKMRVDLGSPNTAYVTREFFEQLGAELSYARVQWPTDNSITERFFGTVKQEEAYLVGSYPDEMSAKEEIGRYIRFYNNERPHQTLWNFTPAHVYKTNNKTLILEELQELKRKTRERRKEYWLSHLRPDGPVAVQKNDSLNFPVLSTL